MTIAEENKMIFRQKENTTHKFANSWKIEPLLAR